MDAIIIILLPAAWIFTGLMFKDMDPEMIESFISFYGRG